jgi:hypothetical protein
MKSRYTKPILARLSWAEGRARHQAYALRNSVWYRHSFAPGDGKWEDE